MHGGEQMIIVLRAIRFMQEPIREIGILGTSPVPSATEKRITEI
jgi:hypothetical protein